MTELHSHRCLSTPSLYSYSPPATPSWERTSARTAELKGALLDVRLMKSSSTCVEEPTGPREVTVHPRAAKVRRTSAAQFSPQATQQWVIETCHGRIGTPPRPPLQARVS